MSFMDYTNNDSCSLPLTVIHPWKINWLCEWDAIWYRQDDQKITNCERTYPLGGPPCWHLLSLGNIRSLAVCWKYCRVLVWIPSLAFVAGNFHGVVVCSRKGSRLHLYKRIRTQNIIFSIHNFLWKFLWGCGM